MELGDRDNLGFLNSVFMKYELNPVRVVPCHERIAAIQVCVSQSIAQAPNLSELLKETGMAG